MSRLVRSYRAASNGLAQSSDRGGDRDGSGLLDGSSILPKKLGGAFREECRRLDGMTDPDGGKGLLKAGLPFAPWHTRTITRGAPSAARVRDVAALVTKVFLTGSPTPAVANRTTPDDEKECE